MVELGGKELLLGAQHGEIGRIPAFVLEPRQTGILLAGLDEALLRPELLGQFFASDQRILDIGECALNGRLVGT